MTNLTDTSVPIAWDDTGAGDPLLLVMGLGYGRWAWQPIVRVLAERHRVITFDNRGIGGSGAPEGPYTAAQMAGDAVAVLDAAGVGRAHVAGSSLGGMIAQEIAIHHADRVDHLVLMSTTPGGPNAHPMPQVTVRLIANEDDFSPHELLRRFVANALSANASADLVHRIVAKRLEMPQPQEAWAAQAAAGVSYDGSDRARLIEAPTLILQGEADNVVDVRNARLLGRLIPDSLVKLVPGGHLFFWEDPHMATDLMGEFLGSRP